MTIEPIRNDEDLRRAFRRLEKVFQAEEGTAQADEHDVLITRSEAYENKHYDFGPADPVEAIKFRMEQEGLTPRDLEPYVGQSGRVSEVLNRKRPLSLRMVKRPELQVELERGAATLLRRRDEARRPEGAPRPGLRGVRDRVRRQLRCGCAALRAVECWSLRR